MFWQRLQTGSGMEGKAGNKISEAEMITTEMITQDPGKRLMREKTNSKVGPYTIKLKRDGKKSSISQKEKLIEYLLL